MERTSSVPSRIADRNRSRNDIDNSAVDPDSETDAPFSSLLTTKQMKPPGTTESSTTADDKSRISLYPFNFSTLREGSDDPVLGKKIKWLIDSDDNYIVYIDEDNYVEWTMNSNDMLAGAGEQLTRVGWLEAADSEYLADGQVQSFKRLVGEGVARLFEGNLPAAKAAFDAAEQWIRARNQEAAKIWWLQGAGTAMMVATIVAGLSLWRFGEAMLYGRQVIITGACAAAVGAVLSVLQRSGQADLDIAAGAKVQRIEGFVRVTVGAIGGAFVALLIRSGYVVPALRTVPSLFVAVCLVAGLSERMVNSLASTIESGLSVTPEQRANRNGQKPEHPTGSDALS